MGTYRNDSERDPARIKFKKTGAQIAKVIENKLAILAKRADKRQGRIQALCGELGLSFSDVMAVKDDYALGDYMSKMEGQSIGAVMSQPRLNPSLAPDALRGITQSLSGLKRLLGFRVGHEQQVRELQLVVDNIELERSFDLCLEDLRPLGFGLQPAEDVEVLGDDPDA